MRILCLALVVLVAACASRLPVDIEYNAAADFTKYRTYNWVYATPPEGVNAELYGRLRDSLDRSLQQHGFVPGTPGEVSLFIVLLARDRVQVAGAGVNGGVYSASDWGPVRLWSTINEQNARHLHRATLVVNVIDNATRERIWRGSVSDEILPADFSQQNIDELVDAAVAQFPPDIRCTQVAGLYTPCRY